MRQHCRGSLLIFQNCFQYQSKYPFKLNGSIFTKNILGWKCSMPYIVETFYICSIDFFMFENHVVEGFDNYGHQHDRETSTYSNK